MSEQENKTEKYAIVEHGGKQFRVEEGDVFTVDRITGAIGETIEFGRPLLIAQSSETKVGTPVVAGASVKAKIVGHERAKKILVFKFKKRKNYRRMRGHRQELTRLKVESISLS